eukprot:2964266-Pyramimonas_sp.AAC.1
MSNYYASIDEYNELTRPFSKFTLAHCDMFGDIVNVGVGLFIDDLLKLLAFPPGTSPGGIRNTSNLDAECLDESGEAWEYRQSRTKAEIVITASRRGITQALVAVKAIVGTILPELKHLGGMFSASGSNVAERYERLRAINRAWNQLSGFWHSKAGRRPRRLLFSEGASIARPPLAARATSTRGPTPGLSTPAWRASCAPC